MSEAPEDLREKADAIVVTALRGPWRAKQADAIAIALLAHERETIERCAKIAQDRHEAWRMPHPDDASPGEVCCDISACADIATTIRETAR